MANPAQTVKLPDVASVFVEMEQFNDRSSVGRVVVTDAGQLETVLSADGRRGKNAGAFRQRLPDAG